MLFSLRPCAYYQRKHPATQAATSRITAQHGPRDGCTAHLTAQHQQQQAFQTLKEHTPVCLADVTEIHPGYKALAAASDLHNGQTVLELPPCNSLCVPVSGSIYRWECEWLEPFEMAHGSLPDALSLYLSEMDIQPLMRLAALILYIKKQASSSNNNGGGGSSKDFWSSWLQLLPPLSTATYPGAGWSAAEIQQLQFQPAKALMTVEARGYEVLIALLRADLRSTDRGLQRLHLADDLQDILWAVFVAKTRSTQDEAAMKLHPVHDFLNHSDTSNCSPITSSSRYLVKAEEDIPAGAELTISYIPPEGVCNLELLMAWGFTTPTRPQDWALPQIFHLLPPISYNIALAAAVKIVTSRLKQTAAAGEDLAAVAPLTSMEYVFQLATAAASLPLALSNSSKSDKQSTAAVVAQYAHAADMLEQCGLDQLQQEGSDVLLLPGADWSKPFEHPDNRQSLEEQRLFVNDYHDKVTSAAEVLRSPSVKRAQQWHQETFTECMQGLDSTTLGLQQLSAAAVHNECQLLLLRSGTTVQQDAQLLLLLGQQQQQPELSTAPAQPGSTVSKSGQHGRLCTTSRAEHTSAGAAAAEARSTDIITFQHNAEGRLFGPSGAPAPNAKVSKQQTVDNSSSSSSSSSHKLSQQSSTAADSKYQELLQQFEQLQQQTVRHLMLLQACNAADASGGSSRRRHSIPAVDYAAETAMQAAAQKVIKVLDPALLKGQYAAWHQQHSLAQQASQLQQQQQELLKQITQLQQQQQQGIAREQTAAGTAGANSDIFNLIDDPMVNKGWLLTAVTYRLEQKKLLQLCAELAEKVQEQVAALRPAMDQGL